MIETGRPPRPHARRRQRPARGPQRLHGDAHAAQARRIGGDGRVIVAAGRAADDLDPGVGARADVLVGHQAARALASGKSPMPTAPSVARPIFINAGMLGTR